MFITDYLLEYNRYLNIVGIVVILGCAWLLSAHRSKINYMMVVNGLVMQFAIAFFVLKTGIGHGIIAAIANAVGKLYQFAQAGSSFVFGNLTDASQSWGFIFAVNVLPIIIFFGAFMSLLFHLNIIQVIVAGVSKVVRPLLGTSGAETLCAIANSFLGQTEAPLLIRNYLAGMTKSELFVVMVSGMATVSGSILVVYAAMGVPAQHLLAASVMAVPGALIIAKIMLPETEKPETVGGAQPTFEKVSQNTLDAIAQGTSDGLQLALNVGAMLVSFLALIALVNALFDVFGMFLNYALSMAGSSIVVPQLSLNYFFSYIFSPFSYLLGFKGSEALRVGSLLGTKITINELVAYGEMLKASLSERTMAIVTYALCGFANFSCIGIQIGGIGALVPSKRSQLSALGVRAVIAGSLTNILSAMIAALLL